MDQLRVQSTFRFGSRFAALIKADPALKKLYADRGAKRRPRRNFRQVALADIFHGPEVWSLDPVDYRKVRGGTLRITARDDFEVVRVTCALRAGDGSVLMAGHATLHASRMTSRVTYHETQWDYVVPAVPEGGAGRILVVTVFDRPGNFEVKQFPL